jgi:hypothetical protein
MARSIRAVLTCLARAELVLDDGKVGENALALALNQHCAPDYHNALAQRTGGDADMADRALARILADPALPSAVIRQARARREAGLH